MVDGFDTIELTCADGALAAEFVPEANLLCCSLRHRGAELLHQGSGVSAYARLGQTMGIPLLHPWANRLAGLEYRVEGKVVSLAATGGRIALDPCGLAIHGALPGAPAMGRGPSVSGPDQRRAALGLRPAARAVSVRPRAPH